MLYHMHDLLFKLLISFLQSFACQQAITYLVHQTCLRQANFMYLKNTTGECS